MVVFVFTSCQISAHAHQLYLRKNNNKRKLFLISIHKQLIGQLYIIKYLTGLMKFVLCVPILLKPSSSSSYKQKHTSSQARLHKTLINCKNWALCRKIIAGIRMVEVYEHTHITFNINIMVFVAHSEGNIWSCCRTKTKWRLNNATRSLTTC